MSGPTLLTKGELRAIDRTLHEAESIPLPPAVRDLVIACRRVCVDYAALLLAHRDATELAAMRFEANRSYAKRNEALITQNIELCNALERYERRAQERAS